MEIFPFIFFSFSTITARKINAASAALPTGSTTSGSAGSNSPNLSNNNSAATTSTPSASARKQLLPPTQTSSGSNNGASGAVSGGGGAVPAAAGGGNAGTTSTRPSVVARSQRSELHEHKVQLISTVVVSEMCEIVMFVYLQSTTHPSNDAFCSFLFFICNDSVELGSLLNYPKKEWHY